MKIFENVSYKDMIHQWIGAFDKESSFIKSIRSVRALQPQTSHTHIP